MASTMSSFQNTLHCTSDMPLEVGPTKVPECYSIKLKSITKTKHTKYIPNFHVKQPIKNTNLYGLFVLVCTSMLLPQPGQHGPWPMLKLVIPLLK
jgi:hypothetical protein